MANKKRGFRKIVVKNDCYNWRFDKMLDIRPEVNRNNKVYVDIGWFDEFLYINSPENKPPDYEPKNITPSFVLQAIVFAIENGWDINLISGVFEMRYTQGEFSTK